MADGPEAREVDARTSAHVDIIARVGGLAGCPRAVHVAPGMDAFISHSSQQADLAARVEAILEADGLEVWLDRSEIRLGALLRRELQSSIEACRVLVLLWSKAAAKSRWVAAELLTAYHLDRFILAGTCDSAQPPFFLRSTIYLDFRRPESEWAPRLARAVRESAAGPNEIPPDMRAPSAEVDGAVRTIAARQAAVLDRLGVRDLDGARAQQKLLDPMVAEARKRWKFERDVLNLAGYHAKNGYLLKHWDAIQAGRPPADPLLARAERCFFDALFVAPGDASALNGLGSVLILERELDAAEFFVRRAIAIAEASGLDYPDAKHDLELIRAFARGQG
jgi:hypothetical protein